MSNDKTAQQNGKFKSFLSALFGRNEEQSLEETVAEAIAEHEEESDGAPMGAGEKEMLFNVLQYGELRVDDVMVPRADIIAADIDTPFEDIVQLFASESHSRVPLYRGSMDDILGMLHVKDVLGVMASKDAEVNQDSNAILNIQRPVLFVPASMKVIDLLAKMRANRTHMAIVVDEYGGTDGIVTIEDLVEEIVGDIEDEHDDDQSKPVRELTDGSYLVDARMMLEDLQEEVGFDIVNEDMLEEIDTLGGLVFDMAGKVPEIGEIIEHDSGLSFEVVDADPRRIGRIRIHTEPYQTGNLATVTQE